MIAPLLGLALFAQATPTVTPPPAPDAADTAAAGLGQFFQMVDADHDGSVTRAEFDGFFAAAQAKSGKEMDMNDQRGLSTFFTMLDADGNGTVTPAEQQKFAAFASAAEARDGG